MLWKNRDSFFSGVFSKFKRISTSHLVTFSSQLPQECNGNSVSMLAPVFHSLFKSVDLVDLVDLVKFQEKKSGARWTGSRSPQSPRCPPGCQCKILWRNPDAVRLEMFGAFARNFLSYSCSAHRCHFPPGDHEFHGVHRKKNIRVDLASPVMRV